MEEMNEDGPIEDNLDIEEAYSEDDVEIEACPVETGALGARPEGDSEHAVAQYKFHKWAVKLKVLRYLNDTDTLALLGPTRWLLNADGMVKSWVARYCDELARKLPAPEDLKKVDYRKKYQSARMQAGVFTILLNLAHEAGEWNVNSRIFDSLDNVMGLAPRMDNGKPIGQVFDASIPVGQTPVRDMLPSDNVATRIDFLPDFSRPAPVWIAFLRSIMSGEADRAQFLEDWAGYCMTRSVKFEKFLILGSMATANTRERGRNGKGKYCGVLADLLGPLAHPLGFDRIMTSHNASRDLRRTMGDIHGMNLVTSAEPNETTGQKLDQSLIKNITGGDRTEAAKVYEKTSTRKPTWKLILNLNTTPELEHTLAMKDRTIYLEFRESYTDENGRKDPDLSRKLEAEYPAILARLLLAGQRIYHLTEFPIPASVIASSKRLFAKTDYAVLFVESSIKADPKGFIPAREMTEAAKGFVERTGAPGATIPPKDLAVVLEEMGATHVKRGERATRVWGWAGVAFV